MIPKLTFFKAFFFLLFPSSLPEELSLLLELELDESESLESDESDSAFLVFLVAFFVVVGFSSSESESEELEESEESYVVEERSEKEGNGRTNELVKGPKHKIA